MLRKRNSDPIAEAERDIAALQSRRSALSDRLQSAETELHAASDQRRELLTGGDLADEGPLKAVEDKLATAERSRNGLVEALTLVDERLSAANVRLSELREAAEREWIAGGVIAEVAALGDARETFTAAASTLVAGVRQVVARVPGVMPDFEPRLASIVGEIPLAVDELVSAARRYASNIAAGSEPLPRPMALAPKPESPPDVARPARRQLS